jgi:DNA polymerase/3'-5' exonuclease PolX
MMKLEEAQQLAARIVQTIDPLCERTAIVGSVRRRRPEVHDIDIVVIPKPFMWGRIPILMRSELEAMQGIAGPELIRMYVPFANNSERRVQVDFYAATAQTWGVILLIRTGSTDHNIRLCTHAKALGMMLSASRGVIEKGVVIASKTEEEIFKALILPYVAPGDREIT